MATAEARPKAGEGHLDVVPGTRQRTWSLDRVLNRSIVYAALTGAILLVYATSVVVFRALLPGDVPYAVALVSTGAGALLALPLRDRLQRAVNRLMYGDRHEPYRAISRLGRQLDATAGKSNIPEVVVTTVAEALRLPYAAVELDGGSGRLTAAVHGERPPDLDDGDLLRLRLAHGGELLGELLLAPRSPGEAFNAADRQLLDDLARQAGPAIHASRLTVDLRRSREHLVTTREEERRRLRRELHDGVGPTLAGTLMKLEAARSRLTDHPDEADRLLVDLAADTRRTIDEVRRLTFDLRPPALDELGLVGAIREQAARFERTPGGPAIDVQAALPAALPAAVEVAAYRIAVEALTNVARHSGARIARVRIDLEHDALMLEVVDDGRGRSLGGPTDIGVGLRSMRERAEELGGSLSVTDAAGGGTRVRACLPMRSPTRA